MKLLSNLIRRFRGRKPKAILGGRPIYSDFVLNRLRDTPWQHHGTVLEFIEVEQHILGKTRSASQARHRCDLMNRHPGAAREIEAELISAEELKDRQRQSEQRQREAEAAKKTREEDQTRIRERLRRQWIELGGLP